MRPPPVLKPLFLLHNNSRMAEIPTTFVSELIGAVLILGWGQQMIEMIETEMIKILKISR